MNGTGIRRYVVEQRLACHVVVAALVFVRHLALVAPVDVHVLPRCVTTMIDREASVEVSRRTAAGKRN
jgi:hypothetical protein